MRTFLGISDPCFEVDIVLLRLLTHKYYSIVLFRNFFDSQITGDSLKRTLGMMAVVVGTGVVCVITQQPIWYILGVPVLWQIWGSPGITYEMRQQHIAMELLRRITQDLERTARGAKQQAMVGEVTKVLWQLVRDENDIDPTRLHVCRRRLVELTEVMQRDPESDIRRTRLFIFLDNTFGLSGLESGPEVGANP